MKINWNIIKLGLALILTGFLFSFSNQRNQQRLLRDIQVYFVEGEQPMMTVEAVNKLLIQNNDTITSIPKEALVLKEMEYRLKNHPMVRDAQVYVTINGEIGAQIRQRNPIGRVLNATSYYVDEEGDEMPLSKVYSARVPIISLSSDEGHSVLTPLLNAIQKDNFMKSMVTGLQLQPNGEVVLNLRKQTFRVHFGKVSDITRKFENFKAFYKKAQKDNTLSDYRSITLKFGKQVVATKK